MNYMVVDGHGNEITRGLQDNNVWSIAQAAADRRGEAVYVLIEGDCGESDPEVGTVQPSVSE